MYQAFQVLRYKTAAYVNSNLSSYNVKPEMLGTMLNNGVYGEGRTGWFYSTFLGASGRGLEEGKITPQSSKNTSSILLNPFLRIANADDKANNPTKCYRASGSYIEKNYYNDSDKNGSFYIFDFAKYMEVQGIATPDVVVIALKPESVEKFTEDMLGFNLTNMKLLVQGIREALPDTHIALIPQYGSCTKYNSDWELFSDFIVQAINFVNDSDDNKLKVLPAWLHMNREFGTKYTKHFVNTQLQEEYVLDCLDNCLSELAKIELANAITSFIMNI